MKRKVAGLLALIVAVSLATAAPAAATPAGTAQSSIASPTPSARTPSVNNGTVLAIVQVGNTLVLGGTFTSVTPFGGTAVPRNYLVAVDATSGALVTTFNPAVNGEVRSLAVGPGNTIYVGGRFSTVNGVGGKVHQLDVTTGARVAGFRADPINGVVNDLALSNGRLFLSGFFTTVNGLAHRGVAALNATTGRVDPTLNVNLTGHHNYGRVANSALASVGGYEMGISPDGASLVVGGNFVTASSGGVNYPRDQIVKLRVTSTSVTVDAGWKSNRYTQPCFNTVFDFYMRGIQFSPDGSYFAVVTTGGYHSASLELCDAAARFETNGTGQDIQPTWANWTGADSLYVVAVSGSAVYVGGHQRWLNNPNGQDAAGDSAVPRPGIAALDPRNGVPLAWNPGRHPRGHGAEAMFLSPNGLYVGSDTDWIGNFAYKRPKISYFPLAGGAPLNANATPGLPGRVYLAGSRTVTTPNAITARTFDGTAAGPNTAVAGPTGFAWDHLRGGFVADGKLYYARDGALYSRPFAGGTFGAETKIDPYNDPYWSKVNTGSNNTVYRGTVPGFYPGTASVPGLAFANGWLYYTVDGQPGLYRRTFSTQSGVLGPLRYNVPTGGNSFNGAGGMFIANGRIYVALRSNGTLRSAPFDAVRGAVTGPFTTVAGAGTGWGNARALFLGQ